MVRVQVQIQERAKIVARVGKLLRMARGQANEHESAVAAAMAARLMREHQLDEHQVILGELAQGLGLGHEDSGRWRRCPDWQGLLAVATARLFGCEVDRCDHPSAAGYETLRFYGYASDTLVAKWTFEYLIAEIQRRFAGYCADAHLPRDPRTRRDYGMGAAQSILRTLEEAAAAAESDAPAATGPEAALLVRGKEAAIREAFGAFAYQPTPLPERPAPAFLRGRADGRAITLHRPLSHRRGCELG